MANRKIRVAGLIFATLVVLFITSVIGYFVAAQYTAFSSKQTGKELTYLPEKIVKIETELMSKSGIHFRGESGKLFTCNNLEKACNVRSDKPKKYEEKTPFAEVDETYRKFRLPKYKIKQIVLQKSRGLVGHQTASQYALLEDGRVWHWVYSGNEMGDSFPFWHLNNLTPLLIGTILGFLVGLILSVFIWFIGFPRKV